MKGALCLGSLKDTQEEIRAEEAWARENAIRLEAEKAGCSRKRILKEFLS